ncbi:MAG: peroxidase-related enzyme [Candidatus Binatia bacterium]
MSHAEFLRKEGGDDLAAEQIKVDWRQANLTDAERAMLEYVEKLTLTPSSMKKEDVQKLRDAGWTDRDILDICQVAAYFNYRVRMADGLGVDLDEAYNQSAQSSRERAREEARKLGKELPPDRWQQHQEKKQA